MKKAGCIGLSLLLSVILLIGPLAHAAQAEDSSSAANQMEILLTPGSTDIQINGVKAKIEKPYKSNGVTMVPLSVITKAFGAKLKFDAKTKVIVLDYNNKTITLTIGSPLALVNGMKKPLQAAPQIKAGTTMVPLRFISEEFGATVSVDGSTGQIKIVGTNSAVETAPAPTTNTGNQNGIDSDAGKTSIGDSYYKWSMKYSSALVLGDRSFKGDSVIFNDAKSEYSIYVYAEKLASDNLSKDAILKKMSDYASGTILDKKFETGAGGDYAKVVSKDKEEYYEDRGYVQNGYLYYVTLEVYKAENYKNQTKYKGYKELLDSFRTSFDANNSALKDLSNVKNGSRSFTGEGYGFTLQVPAEWDEYDDSNYFSFNDEDGVFDLTVRINSIKDGDTLDTWAEREVKLVSEDYLPSKFNKIGNKSLTLDGVTARMDEYSYSIGKKWYVLKDVFAYSGKYKYNFTLSYDKDLKSVDVEKLAEQIFNSIGFQPKNMDPSLGSLPAEWDTLDKSKRMTIKSTKYNYSIEIPEYWEPGKDNNDEDSVSYMSQPSAFFLDINTDETYSEILKDVDQNFADSKTSVLTSKTTETFAGVSAAKYVYTTKDDNSKQGILYVFEKDSRIYSIEGITFDVAATSDNLQRITDTINSFKFLQ